MQTGRKSYKPPGNKRLTCQIMNNILKNLWWKNKFGTLFAVIFSIIYVIVGCIWFLAPSDKYSLHYSRNFGSLGTSVVRPLTTLQI
jgi:hypothetical protein